MELKIYKMLVMFMLDFLGTFTLVCKYTNISFFVCSVCRLYIQVVPLDTMHVLCVSTNKVGWMKKSGSLGAYKDCMRCQTYYHDYIWVFYPFSL